MLKEMMLRLHYALKVGVEVVGALMSLPDICERMMQMLKDVANDEGLFEVVKETGFLNLMTEAEKVKVEDVRRMLECKFFGFCAKNKFDGSDHVLLNVCSLRTE